MNDENTKPSGRFPLGTTARRAGTQMNTKVYIAPSNKAVLAPSNTIRGSARRLLITVTGGPLPSGPSWSPKFSSHCTIKSRAATVRPIAAWKGPMSPRASAETCATNPATIATTPFPADIHPNVSASKASSNCRRRWADTIQLSKALHSRLFEMPPSTRPTINSGTLEVCSSKLTTTSTTQYNTHPARRPQRSTFSPTTVPKMQLDKNPMQNSPATFTP
mmetsp:Transcript_10245/g.24423  ORF Transcript_10245/g.24423 Transcript_10245/m.24423 type:complete len:219 (-) Transcript_10245:46-702(-)